MTELDKDALDAAARAIAGGGSLRDAIRAYLDAADDWRPMETAPRERFINLYCPDDKSIWWAKWQGGEWYGIDDHGLTRRGHSAGDPNSVMGWAVAKWRPLPSPPKEG
jgi:hypothetical protein